MTDKLPKIITFDGEARSGKGTIIQMTKDYLRDECGHKVMLVDIGQVFRVLVVAVTRAGVDLSKPHEIDDFLNKADNIARAAEFVKEVYHMPKQERDGLLYTNEVGANSAVIAARPASQEFKDELLRKWLKDAGDEGYEIVLLDGRALEETGEMLVSHRLCEFVLGLYFVCDPSMGAMRTLGYAPREYGELDSAERANVDKLVVEINERNRKDFERKVQPVAPPKKAKKYFLPDIGEFEPSTQGRPMAIIDTSASMTKSEMAMPVARAVGKCLGRR